jgi:hypothetical protein
MRNAARFAIALASAALFAGALTSVAQASFGVTESNFEAGTCTEASCTYAATGDFYTQAAGHPPFGITTFELNHHSAGLGQEPEGALKRVRVDIPPGLAADPQALPACSDEDFNSNKCPANTKVGTNELTVFASLSNLTISGTVYNLEPKAGLPLVFGIDVAVEPLVNVHIFLEGHVSWSTDYHEYFEINNIPREGELAGLKVPLAVLKSKLIFEGQKGNGKGTGNFLTLPSVCSTSTTSHLEVESYEGAISKTETHTPVGVEGCGKVPFEPTAEVIPATGTAGSDEPDGATTVVKAKQNAGAGEINTADIQDAHVTLPEGMTLDPSAAHELGVCTPAQIAIGSSGPSTCPASSRVGTVTIETDLPPGSLTGGVYLGDPAGGPIKKPPYTIYLDAESGLGVSVRLQGLVTPNLSTGRLEVTFANNPQLPFSELRLSLNGGPRAPFANPLVCGNAPVESLFTAYTGEAPFPGSFSFAATGCPSPIPFALTQTTASVNATAGAYSPYTFNLTRADGQQYLSQISTTLPAGLLGAIPSVTLCDEPQAATGTCTAASQIGTVTVTAGAGSEPYQLVGTAYLTGSFDGAPYGLSIAVPVIAGPFNLGTVLARASIRADPHTARVIVSTPPAGTPGALPTIVGGVPVRLRTLRVEVNRPSFIFNPTNCGPLATESTLMGFTAPGSNAGATQSLSSPFQVGGCSALPFKPSFKISASARTSKKNGASLRVSLTQPAHEANLHSVVVELPKQLPSRLTTLQKACPEATFAANPVDCRPLGSEVGSATVVTPVLPGQLSGSAYLVSHGGESFPDLDLVLEGDGVKVILTGNTKIAKGITSSTFAAIPDVPVTSFVLNLPVGPHSALTAVGGLCAKALIAPTTILAQSGAQLSQKTRISVTSCPVQILSHRVVGHRLVLRVRTFAAGRVSVRGKNLRAPLYKRFNKATTTTIKIPLSRGGLRALARHRRLKVRVRVGFVPKQRAESVSAASVGVSFK